MEACRACFSTKDTWARQSHRRCRKYFFGSKKNLAALDITDRSCVWIRHSLARRVKAVQATVHGTTRPRSDFRDVVVFILEQHTTSTIPRRLRFEGTSQIHRSHPATLVASIAD